MKVRRGLESGERADAGTKKSPHISQLFCNTVVGLTMIAKGQENLVASSGTSAILRAVVLRCMFMIKEGIVNLNRCSPRLNAMTSTK